MADSLLIEEPPSFAGDDLASSVIVEPPPAADAVASVGTLPPAAMQFADLTESGSESGEDEPNSSEQQQQQQQQLESSSSNGAAGHNTPAARSSPPPNCAICLSRCRRKCFTDSCMHQFCFKCLSEWSKIKPECPLCKQPFRTIIHNVRTLDDYDRYTVESNPPEHSALSFHIFNIRRQRYMLQNQAVMTDNATDESQDEPAAGYPHFRIPALYYRSEPFRMELMNYYRNDQEQRGSWTLNQLWRRYVYDRKLYSIPVMDPSTGNYREWSARFYRDNPSQMHRLMPWINRDIVCLLRNAPNTVSEVMQMMHDILPMINIPTRTFRRRLSPFLGERTNHFIHELFNFARSPFDMVGYDRVVQYSTRVAEEVEVDLLDLVSNNESGMPQEPNVSNAANAASNSGAGSGGSGGGGNEVIGSVGDPITSLDRLPRPMTSVIVTNPSATHSFSVTMNTDGSELPGISIRRTTTSNVGSQTVAINLSMRRPANEVIEIDDGDAAANAEVAAINDSNNQAGRRQAVANLPISAHIELQSSDCSNSSDDDDECVFVLERKPPHLRTPELVSLDSNSDSDVVFVDEQKATPPPKAAASSADSNASNEPPAEATGNEQLFMGASTSTGVLSTSGKNWKMVLEDARRQDLIRSRGGRSKRTLTRNQQRAQPVAGSGSSDSTMWTSTTSDSSSNSDDDSHARRKKRAIRKPRTRKRAAKNKMAAQYKSKRRRKNAESDVDVEAEAEADEEEDKPREQVVERRESSSASSSMSSCEDDSSDSSEATGNNNMDNNDSSSSNSSTDDDSTDNLMLSALRATLKAEGDQPEDRKPTKRELPDAAADDDDEDATAEGDELHQPQQQQYVQYEHQCECGGTIIDIPQPLSTVHDIAHSLIELSTLSVGGSGGASGGGLFNEQSQGVEDSMSYLRNTFPSGSSLNAHDDDAQLGLYSDSINVLQHYQNSVNQVLDVVGDSQEEETADADADDNNQPDELEEEEHEQDELVEEEEIEQEQEHEQDEEQDEQQEHLRDELRVEEPQQEQERAAVEEVHEQLQQEESNGTAHENEDDYDDEEEEEEEEDAESDVTDSDQDATTDAY